MSVLEQHKTEGIFPYRYLKDEHGKLVPIVLISAFFRDDRSRDLYYDYVNNGIKVIGITAYKTFPHKITDPSEDKYHLTDGFDYVGNIKNWLCCFRDPTLMGGFTSTNHMTNISESDFYDVEVENSEKKYDLIYVCLNDHDTPDKPCPVEGWNAINRNFKMAQSCFPILINDYGWKILVVGRTNCGLEDKFGDRIETVGFLPYHEFQEKIRQSRFLFVPNIYDASPRIVAESITKGLPVLMNRNIVCGSKYITYETGELFTDENDLRYAVDALLAKEGQISPRKWWSANYGTKVSGNRMRNFIMECYPGFLDNNVQEISFA